MNDNFDIKNMIETNVDLGSEPESRILIILHPNTSRIDLNMNDRRFNNEKYSFSRNSPAKDSELKMLNAIFDIIGIEDAKTAQNKMQLEISGGMRHDEFIPQTLVAIKEWAGAGYNPQIYVDDRRWDKIPEDNDGWGMGKPGVRKIPGSVKIGVEYKPWFD